MVQYSIIIPTYNSSKTIVRLLDSFKQTKNDFYEVIIVDDCSTDETISVVDEYKQSSEMTIRVISKEKNSGPGVSRNMGIKAASGEYICFMDSDDYVSNSYFSAINKGLDMGAEVVYFNAYQVTGDNESPIFSKGYKTREDYIALTTGSLCMFCSKRSLWDGIELPPIKNAEDIAVIPVVMSRAKKIVSIPDYLYYYINNSHSLSNSYSPKISENFMKSFSYTLKLIDRDKYVDQIEFHGIKTILYGATLNALKANVDSTTLKKYWDSFTMEFPKWYNNRYLSNYPLKKKFFLFMVRFRLLFVLRLYTSLHTYLLNR